MSEPHFLPPMPPAQCPEIGLLMAGAANHLREGVDVFQVVLNVAVNSWLAGHVHGEDACTGCTERGAEGHDWQARQDAIAASYPRAMTFLDPETWHQAAAFGQRA